MAICTEQVTIDLQMNRNSATTSINTKIGTHKVGNNIRYADPLFCTSASEPIDLQGFRAKSKFVHAQTHRSTLKFLVLKFYYMNVQKTILKKYGKRARKT